MRVNSGFQARRGLTTAAAESDPDALPLADEQMSAMITMRVLRGRPKVAIEKQLVSI